MIHLSIFALEESIDGIYQIIHMKEQRQNFI